jgi:hypothetical protein
MVRYEVVLLIDAGVLRCRTRYNFLFIPQQTDKITVEILFYSHKGSE